MRILGIDIGSSSIKAVELDSAFGRYEIHEYHEQKIPAGTEPQAALHALISSLPKPPDRVVTALRTGQLTFRSLQLPTRDKKAIQTGVGFELEDDLPFPIEQAAFDYSILSQTKQSSQLHVVATLKRHLAAALEVWSAGGLDPDIVTSEAWAYRTLFNRILTPAEQETPSLLIQMGSERTSLYVHHRQAPILAREIPFGGQDLTLAIHERYNVPLEQAEVAKLDHGFVIPSAQKKEATAEQLEFSRTLVAPLQRLIADLRQTELSCKSATNQTLGQVFISGGSSVLPGLTHLLQEVLRVPVRPLKALSALSTSGVSYSEQADSICLLAASLALCTVGSERSQVVNLRKGDFAKQTRSRELNWSNLRRPLLAVAAITVCFFTSLFVQSTVYDARLKDTNAQLESGVKRFFGTNSSSAVRTYMASTTTLKANINKELTHQRELAQLVGANPHSPLRFLKELSAAVPKSIVVDEIQFQVGAAPDSSFLTGTDRNATLTFLVSNAQAADQLGQILSARLSSFKKGQLEEAPVAANPDGQPAEKRFKITFNGKPTEDSYGK